MLSVAQELCPGTKVYGFDSFAGMPEADARRDAHKAGDFGETSGRRSGSLPRSSGCAIWSW
jgi:hypothetical protein